MITNHNSPFFAHAGRSGSNPEQRPGTEGRGAFQADAYPLGRPAHGGQCHPGILDFSVNLNPLAPWIADSTWLRWKSHAMRYPPTTSDAISARLAGMLGSEARQTVVTNGGMENTAFWRVAVRAPEENIRFIAALNQSLNTLSPQPSGITGTRYSQS